MAGGNGNNSVYQVKTKFLDSQIRILGQLPDAPKGWQDAVPASEHGDLSESVLSQVFYKLSIVARRHQKLVYSAQALRHVAEQIDTLYWEQSAGFEGAPPRQDEVLRRGTDLRDPDNIAALPETLADGARASEHDQERYAQLRSRLQHASSTLQAQRQKHAYYKHLQRLVQPFREPLSSVQPNLVTRDGLLGQELERTRMLAAKLAVQVERARAGGLVRPEEGRGGGRGGEDAEDADDTEEEGEGDGEGEGEENAAEKLGRILMG